MSEVWKPVVGWEAFYEVSNHGNVRSLDRIILQNCGPRKTPCTRMSRGKLMQVNKIDKYGYRCVSLRHMAQNLSTTVHRLVAQAFIDNPDGKSQVNHKNGDKLDNRVENLEWATSFENMQHAVANLNRHGERMKSSKIKDADVVDIRFLLGHGVAQADVARAFGVSRKTIHSLQHGRTWSRVA